MANDTPRTISLKAERDRLVQLDADLSPDVVPFNVASSGSRSITPGPKILDLAKFGLRTDAQWLLTIPSRYEDYKTPEHDLGRLFQGTVALVQARVISKHLFAGKTETLNPREGTRIEVDLEDRFGQRIRAVGFGRPGYSWKNHTEGSTVVVRGTPRRKHFNNGEMVLDGVELVGDAQLGRVIPVYQNLKVTKGERFAERVNANFGLLEEAAFLVNHATGWMDAGVASTLSQITTFASSLELVKALHRPDAVDRGEQARRAAKFLSAWSLVRATSERVASVRPDPRSVVKVDVNALEKLKQRLPFKLTDDQEHAISGICDALRSTLPMTGLLTGDVGSGKTAVFTLPLIAAFMAGKKAVLMTPNLLLIDQIQAEMVATFPEIPLCIVRALGGVNGDPDASIVIGSTALLTSMKKGRLGRKPDFLVVDEQHKFSVGQRDELRELWTNTLEATATPIPRTAALATHGAKDLFLLRQIPTAKVVTSRVLGRSKAKDARNSILEAVHVRGEQAAVIYPMIDTADAGQSLSSLSEAAANWSRTVPSELITVLHGRMKPDEKQAALRAFRSGKTRLLLASTVVEVGLTLPELKTMLVIGAENFGVVTLHQLRGRLARKGGRADFIMFTESQQIEAQDRLKMVAEHNDGFELAERDAEARGYGDVLGLEDSSQSGRTRSLFLGAEIGPRDISFALNVERKRQSCENASLAAELVNAAAKRGDNLRIL